MNETPETQTPVDPYVDPVAYLASYGIEAELIAVEELPCAA